MKTNITNIQIHPILPHDGLVGFASFVLNDSLFLSSIGILTRPTGGYRLAYPTKLIANRNMGIFYPINAVLGKEIEECITDKFIQLTGEKNALS